MAYKFLNASLSTMDVNPNLDQLKDSYVNYFQEVLNQEFENASDVWTIQEEIPFSSKLFQDVQVRLMSHVINNDSGDKIGDDYKKILFKDINHATGIGFMYFFDDNYYITINTDKTRQLAASSIIKRCNNTLRWMDTQGGYHTVPCSIDYLIKQNRDYSTAGTSLVMPAATIQVHCQMNDESNLIRPNQRFLFGNPGNWNAYKILGGGVNNFNLLKTSDNTSTGIIRLTLDANYVNNETDDLVNGICDAFQLIYNINLSDHVLSGSIGGSRILIPELTKNGETASGSFVWVSSNPSVATVDINGNVTFISNGNCSIKCSLLNNVLVYDSCSVSVSATPVTDYQVILSPDINYILQGDTQVFNVKLYLNGVAQLDTFTFTVNPNTIPSLNYVFSTIDGNNFSIKNIKKFVGDTLTVTCTSGLNSTQENITLKGVF